MRDAGRRGLIPFNALFSVFGRRKDGVFWVLCEYFSRNESDRDIASSLLGRAFTNVICYRGQFGVGGGAFVSAVLEDSTVGGPSFCGGGISNFYDRFVFAG